MKIHLSPVFRCLLLAAAVLPLANCASGPGTAALPAPAPMAESVGYAAPSAPLAASRETSSPTLAKRNKSRPGLATKAGDETWSAVADLPFYRKTTGQPDAVDSFHYNDETGARAMVEALGGGHRRSGSFSMAGGRLDVALKGTYSGPYQRYEAAGKRIVIGTPGSSYGILLSNRTKHTVEVVASVDSLDVMDGKPASVRKRGYIIPAKSELAIEGFRVNAQKVKSFVFGSVDASAAAKAGVARNVGVIGLAVYDEDEAQSKLARLVESQKRGAADPFAVPAR
ncbi:MAG: hypothetical protein V4675_09020 [Verrucomicrobiota bacterium]